MAWVSYFSIKRSGKTLVGVRNTPGVLIRCDAQTIMAQHDARCKQIYGWHFHVPHVFPINFHIKLFLFRVIIQNILQI